MGKERRETQTLVNTGLDVVDDLAVLDVVDDGTNSDGLVEATTDLHALDDLAEASNDGILRGSERGGGARRRRT